MIISVRIPQIGEGLQEARLVAHLKRPGESVRRDEPIYQMETDKAVMDVESPYEGVLVEWLGEQDQILAIGAEVARMEVAGDAKEMVVHGTATTAESAPVSEPYNGATASRNAAIPPRTRAHAKELGLSDEELATVPSAGSKLMPADIDAYLEAKAASPKAGYSETPMPVKQRLLASRLLRGSQNVIPGTMSIPLKWGSIERQRELTKQTGGEFQPSTFTMFAYAVVRALKGFPAFRSSVSGDDKVRTYEHAALGIAVTLPGDELVLAVIEDADTLDWWTFASKARERIELARSGKDQSSESVTISLTNMQSFGIRDAIPVVVAPAVATLFLGAVYNGFDDSSSDPKPVRLANMALTFDHRLINGVGAAEFMNAVKTNVEAIEVLVGHRA